MRVAEPIETDEQTERELRTLSNGRRVEARVKQRASVVLLAAQGWQNKDIAEEVRLDRRQVALWRKRFIEGGLQALMKDASRSGRVQLVTNEVESLIVNTTLHEQPLAATKWSSRALASYLGLSATTVRRVWERNGIKPHTQDSVPCSADTHRTEHGAIDVVGLCVNARERALVFCRDEGGLARAPEPPPDPDALAGDEGCHRLATLFATLEALDDVAVPMRRGRHRRPQWLAFLRLLERRTPKHLQLHLIVDAHAGREAPDVQAWLAAHPRVVVHWQPVDVAWLKRIAGLFRGICVLHTGPQHFAHVPGLERALARYIDSASDRRGPFVWSSGASAPLSAPSGRGDTAAARGGR
ncbi:MAG: IS630 family transposase [Hydrogenophaga sp.]|nr:IS630 family transposase [Hydrogenophaga sp.]